MQLTKEQLQVFTIVCTFVLTFAILITDNIIRNRRMKKLKAKKTKTITIRIDAETRNNLIKIAEAINKSQSDIMIESFKRWLEAREDQKK